MATIKEQLLEKAEFGRFQKENQEAVATFDKEKKNLRVNRKLKEAKAREKQVKIKFQELPKGEVREALIKIGNKPDPIRATFRYEQQYKKPIKLHVAGFYPTKQTYTPGSALQASINTTFKPSQLKQVLEAVKKRYPRAEEITGSRISGMRAKVGTNYFSRIPLRGKKVGLLGLGLSLGEAVRAGKAAYDAKEGKL